MSQLPFATEAEMTPFLRRHVRGLAGAPVRWFAEVPAVNGIPDIALVRFDPTETRRRRRHGLTMTDDLCCIRTALALADHSQLTVAQIAAKTGVSRAVLTGRVLPTLQETGWVDRQGDGWTATVRYADPAHLLVSVELKLRDWKRALGQGLQATTGSDMSWVVLDQRSTAAVDNLKHFAVRNVGLALLGRDRLQIVLSPRQSNYDPARRAVYGERLYAMRDAGLEVGPARHVFGRVLI